MLVQEVDEEKVEDPLTLMMTMMLLLMMMMMELMMLLQEVDEEKVEDPLTGLSGNSSDLSDSEKSSSMQDLKMKWAGDLTRSLSARRQRSGSRLDHPSPEADNF